jgi:hypothetical protein
MNAHVRDRILRKLDTLSDERGYQLLDYVEFLESKYAERQAPPGNIFTRFTEGLEDTLRAGRVSTTAIAETMSLMNRAMGALSGVAAAGKSVATDIGNAVTAATRPGPATGTAATEAPERPANGGSPSAADGTPPSSGPIPPE